MQHTKQKDDNAKGWFFISKSTSEHRSQLHLVSAAERIRQIFQRYLQEEHLDCEGQMSTKSRVLYICLLAPLFILLTLLFQTN